MTDEEVATLRDYVQRSLFDALHEEGADDVMEMFDALVAERDSLRGENAYLKVEVERLKVERDSNGLLSFPEPNQYDADYVSTLVQRGIVRPSEERVGMSAVTDEEIDVLVEKSYGMLEHIQRMVPSDRVEEAGAFVNEIVSTTEAICRASWLQHPAVVCCHMAASEERPIGLCASCEANLVDTFTASEVFRAWQECINAVCPLCACDHSRVSMIRHRNGVWAHCDAVLGYGVPCYASSAYEVLYERGVIQAPALIAGAVVDSRK